MPENNFLPGLGGSGLSTFDNSSQINNRPQKSPQQQSPQQPQQQENNKNTPSQPVEADLSGLDFSTFDELLGQAGRPESAAPDLFFKEDFDKSGSQARITFSRADGTPATANEAFDFADKIEADGHKDSAARLRQHAKTLNADADLTGLDLSLAEEPEIDRTYGEVAADTGYALLGGFAGLGKNLVYLADLASGGNVPKGFKDSFSRAVEFWEDKKSDSVKQAKRRLDEAEGFTGTIKTLFENPELIGDLLTTSAPSFLPVGIAARGSAALQLGTRATAAAAAGVGGALEAADAGSSAEEEALEIFSNMTAEDLFAQSSEYGKLREDGKTHEEAIEKLASNAGLTAAAVTLPLAVLAGKITGAAKLEADFFTGKGVSGFFGSLAKETAEEAIQEGGNQLGVNAGIKAYADEDRELLDDVDKAATIGGVLGGVQGGAINSLSSLVPKSNDDQNQFESEAVQRESVPESNRLPQSSGPDRADILTFSDGTTATVGEVLDFAQAQEDQGNTVEAARLRRFAATGNVPKKGVSLNGYNPDTGKSGDVFNAPKKIDLNDQETVIDVPAEEGQIKRRNANTGLDAQPENVGRIDSQGDSLKAFVQRQREKSELESFQDIDYQGENELLPEELDKRKSVVESQGISPRFALDNYRSGVQKLVDELIPNGGVAYVRDDNGKIVNRTPSLNPSFFQNNDDLASVSYVNDTVKKALNGDKLRVREQRVIEALLDEVDQRDGFTDLGEYGFFNPGNDSVYYDENGVLRYQDGYSEPQTFAEVEEAARDAGVTEEQLGELIQKNLPLKQHILELAEITKNAQSRPNANTAPAIQGAPLSSANINKNRNNDEQQAKPREQPNSQRSTAPRSGQRGEGVSTGEPNAEALEEPQSRGQGRGQREASKTAQGQVEQDNQRQEPKRLASTEPSPESNDSRPSIFDLKPEQNDNQDNQDTDQAKKEAEQPRKNTRSKSNPEPAKYTDSDFGSKNKLVSRERAEELRKKLKAKFAQLNSGIDPEIIALGAEISVFYIEGGVRKFSDFASKILDDLSLDFNAVQPYLRGWYNSARDTVEDHGGSIEGTDGPDEVKKQLSILVESYNNEKNNNLESDSSISNQDNETQEVDKNAERTARDTQRDSKNKSDEKQDSREDISNGKRGGERPRTNQGGKKRSLFDDIIDKPVGNSSSTTDRERSDLALDSEKDLLEKSTPRDSVDSGSPVSSTGGLFAERDRAAELGKFNDTPVEKPAPIKVGSKKKQSDREQIKSELPFLTDGQIDDVVFAEKRFSSPDGYGVLFTNGTGTGKTFTGLGVARRFYAYGKKNILVVTPKQTINDAWIKAATKHFNIPLKALRSVNDAGEGPVITTFANFAENDAVLGRDYDLIIVDEAHYLSSDKDGSITESLKKLRAISYQEGTAWTRALSLDPDTGKELKALRKKTDQFNKDISKLEKNKRRTAEEDAELRQKQEEIKEITARRGELTSKIIPLVDEQKEIIKNYKPVDRPRVLDLSATPLAYEKNVVLGQGFLYDWGSDQDALGYNSGDNFQQFMMEHFGYRMRYNKLTEPDAQVDRSLKQRTFNAWLKKNGVLSSRKLDSEYDYDRKFVLIEDELGKEIDNALEWLRENSGGEGKIDGMSLVRRIIIADQFDYLQRSRLLEAIKAKEILDHIQKHIDLGRKVVLIHDYKSGLTQNPFKIDFPKLKRTAKEDQLEHFESAEKAYDVFKSNFPKLFKLIDSLPPVIETIKGRFPSAEIYNGDISAAKRVQIQNRFNDDNNTNANLIVAQSDAIREGVSVHDTTGKHQRVLINIGLPSKPFSAIQIEGRTYRTGQASDAIFRYVTIGTAWERHAFASKIAGRASAAENLALGEEARSLKKSFIDAYEEADTYEPGHEDEGKGGKERDAEGANILTQWDLAKSYYFGTKKYGSGRSARGREHSEFFATPDPVGLKMVQLADIRGNEDALEPSAGVGAIARWFPENTNRTAIEITSNLASKLALSFDGKLIQGSFLDHNIVNKYDAIVTNPPYGAGGKDAVEHIEKSLNHLRSGGRLVGLIPTGPAADKAFNRLFARLGEEKKPSIVKAAEILLPKVTFERAGTSIPTKIIVLDKVADINPDEYQFDSNSERYDFSDINDINELFDEIENIEIERRSKPDEEESQEQGVTEGSSQQEQKNAGTGKNHKTWEAQHTKSGENLYMTKPVARVDKSDFNKLREIADKHNGYWSRFGDAGFLFKSDDDRQGFIAESEEFLQAKYSRSSQEKTGSIDIDTVQGVVDRLSKNWSRYAKSSIKVVQSFNNLPQSLQDTVTKDGAESDLRGLFSDDKVYLIADRLSDERSVEEVLFHEAYGHFGLSQLFGKELTSKLNLLYIAIGGKKGLNALAKKYDVDLSLYQESLDNAVETGNITAEERNSVLVEELLAHIQQERPSLARKIKEIVGFIRSWLRDHGFLRLSKVGDTELLELLRGARKATVNATAPSNGNGSVRYSLINDPYREFYEQALAKPAGRRDQPGLVKPGIAKQNSNGNAKGESTPSGHWSDATRIKRGGRPARVYRGGRSQVDKAAFESIGDNTGHPSAHLGVWFTTKKDDAARYGSHISEVYLDVRKPKVFNAENWIDFNSDLEAKRFREKYEKQGYDGLVIDYSSLGGPTHIVSFKYDQVKTDGDLKQAGSSARYSRTPPKKSSIDEIASRVLADSSTNTPVLERAKSYIKDHVERFRNSIRQNLVDQFNSIAVLERQLHGKLLDASQSAYKAAALSKNSRNVTETALNYGAIEYKDGGFDIIKDSKGLLEILKPLGKAGLTREWELWAGAKRAQRLLKEGRENLFTQEDIDSINAHVNADRDKLKLFEQVHKEWIEFNTRTLDLAEASGLIDPESRAIWESNDYVPFHRVSEFDGEDSKSLHDRPKGGLSGQKFRGKKLTGGVERLNIVESMVRNTAYTIEASMKNIAMQRTIEMAEQLEVVESLKGFKVSDLEAQSHLEQHGIEYNDKTLKLWKNLLAQHEKRDGTVSVSVNGKSQRYIVHDPLLLQSISGLGPTSFGTLLGILRFPKSLLTAAVTSDPAFALRNFFRDTLSTYVTVHGKRRNPLFDAVKGVNASLRGSDSLRSLQAQGIGGGYYDTTPESVREHLTKLSGSKNIILTAKDAWRVYRKLLGSTENANRIAVYENALKSGVSKAEAAYQALDVFNYSQHGSNQAVRILIELVPFMNARIQGLDKLWRGAREGRNKNLFNKHFLLKGALLMGATLALLAANADNEEYWDLPEWERDTYYHFWIDGEHWRLPKPFEVGAIFSTIPERVGEQLLRDDANMKLFGERMLSMLSDTFALDPTPQFIKPIVELGRNKSGFTDRQIIPERLKNNSPESQYTPFTKKTFIALADAMPDIAPDYLRSPAKLEHLFNGYFGTLGRYAAEITDTGLVHIGNYPARPTANVQDFPVLGSVYRDGVATNKHVERVYDLSRQIQEIYADINKYKKEGQIEKAEKKTLSGLSKLQAKGAIDKAVNQMAKINRELRQVYDNKLLSPEAKRKQIDSLIETRNEIAKAVSQQYWQ